MRKYNRNHVSPMARFVPSPQHSAVLHFAMWTDKWMPILSHNTLSTIWGDNDEDDDNNISDFYLCRH